MTVMINVMGISDIPGGKQLLLIREVKLRIAALTERHSNQLARGAETKQTEEDVRMYQRLLKTLGREYRDTATKPTR